MNTKTCTRLFTLAVAAVLIFSGNAMAEGGTLQNLGNGICKDKVTGLEWQIAKSKRFTSLDEVKQYVAGQQLGGFSDWRLPTTQETIGLRGLVAIQGNEDCNFSSLKNKYWMVDKKEGVIPARLELECFCRGDYNLLVKHKGYVRVVRNTNNTK